MNKVLQMINCVQTKWKRKISLMSGNYSLIFLLVLWSISISLRLSLGVNRPLVFTEAHKFDDGKRGVWGIKSCRCGQLCMFSVWMAIHPAGRALTSDWSVLYTSLFGVRWPVQGDHPAYARQTPSMFPHQVASCFVPKASSCQNVAICIVWLITTNQPVNKYHVTS